MKHKAKIIGLTATLFMLLLTACDQSSVPSVMDEPLATAATSSHTGAAPAVHMELKKNGEIICKAYNTPADTKPVVTNCPNGTYIEQLFDANWKQIGTNKDVIVGSTSNPGPVTPPNPGPVTPSNPGEAPLRNPNQAFYKFKNTPSDELDVSELMEPSSPEDGGSGADNGGRVGDGNFRISCQYSHFSYDDPILKPGEIDAAHLHMFFGKTNTDYDTDKDNIADSGGGTCNGFALNRSAYWTPALLNNNGKAVIPEQIIVYYKSTRVPEFGVDRMPQGLQLLGGNIKDDPDAPKPSKDSFDVFWSCGGNGSPRKDETKSGTLTELECNDDELINASIYFPQCVARDASGIKLKSDDGFSHTFRLNSVIDECPDDYPVRIPELAILLYYPPQASLKGWELSSDMGADPGSTLHADWIGGWQDETMDLWVENCNRAQRNCTFGQTGTETRLKRAFNKESSFDLHRNQCNKEDAEDNAENCNNDDWMGPYFVTQPAKRR